MGHVGNLLAVDGHAPDVRRVTGVLRCERGRASPHELQVHGNPRGTANGEPRRLIWGTPFAATLGEPVTSAL